ncbi:unnamed protein product [Agarophyton chilense]
MTSNKVSKLSTALLSLVALILIKADVVLGHSHLADPLPTRELHCRVGAQQGRDCYGPCPRADDYGRLNHPWINEHNPAQTWKRGDVVNIRWHRDNHDGTGFVRLVLVPVDKMMDKTAHDQYAFHFSCMNEGLHRCSDRSFDTCGNDAEGMAWQKLVQVPTSYPDGVYVLGWSWYGGGDYRAMSFFGDYYSCSFVEIKGGVAVTESYEPKWDGSTCVSATDRLGICWKEPCHVGRMYEMEPFEFKDGTKPQAIQRSWFGEQHDNGDHDHSRSSGSSVSLGSGASVSIGARSGGRRGEDNAASALDLDVGQSSPQTSNDENSFNTELISTGALGVFFLDFTNWEKIPVKDGETYRLDNFKNGFTVEAFYNGDVRFIDFFVDGTRVRRERSQPFVMQGNRGKLIYGWNPPVGHIVKVQVKVTSKAGRTEGFEADIEFE